MYAMIPVFLTVFGLHPLTRREDEGELEEGLDGDLLPERDGDAREVKVGRGEVDDLGLLRGLDDGGHAQVNLARDQVAHHACG